VAEDEKQPGDLRRTCAEALGNLGVKDKAVDIQIKLYLYQRDKYEDTAQEIYGVFRCCHLPPRPQTLTS
jgi:hypothetical protein